VSDSGVHVGLQSAADWQLAQRAVVAGSLLGAAAIHGSVVGEHLGEWAPAGAFFLGIQLVELSLALLAVTGWRPQVARAVVLSGLATLAVWAVSRTVGMPIGPADFRTPEPVGLTDVVCGILEAASVIAAVPSLRSGAARAAGVAGPRGKVLAVAAAVTAFSLTAWVLGAAVLATNVEHSHEVSRASRSAN
jgi:hypothetical protein